MLKPEQIIADIESLGEKYGLQVDPRAYVWQLGVGEKQRVEILRMLYHRSRVLILDEPTRGVDVGAKREIYELIGEQAAQGKAILMISSDLPEVLGISDRVLVIRQGSVVANLESKKTTEEEIMGYATGVLQPQRLGLEHDEIHDNDEVTFNE